MTGCGISMFQARTRGRTEGLPRTLRWAAGFPSSHSGSGTLQQARGGAQPPYFTPATPPPLPLEVIRKVRRGPKSFRLQKLLHDPCRVARHLTACACVCAFACVCVCVLARVCVCVCV